MIPTKYKTLKCQICGKIIKRTYGLKQKTCLANSCKIKLYKNMKKKYHIKKSHDFKNKIIDSIKNVNSNPILYLNKQTKINRLLYVITLLNNKKEVGIYFCYFHNINLIKSYLCKSHKSKLKNIDFIKVERIYYYNHNLKNNYKARLIHKTIHKVKYYEID